MDYDRKNTESFQFARKDLQENDLMAVTTLDRFCRTVKEGLAYIDVLREKGVIIHLMNMGIMDNTVIGRLIVTNLLAFAEFERAMIIERTQRGKELAKQNPDYREGRPKKYNKKQIDHALWVAERTLPNSAGICA